MDSLQKVIKYYPIAFIKNNKLLIGFYVIRMSFFYRVNIALLKEDFEKLKLWKVLKYILMLVKLL